MNRLRATTGVDVATVVAPAGYGKTTTLAQWAARDERQFAWVTIDERDNDPVVLLRHIAAALGQCRPLDPEVVDALGAPGESIWTAAVPRLAAEMAHRSPIVLVLDDFALLYGRASLDAVEALMDDGPEGSVLVLASREVPRLPLAEVRARGRLIEFGITDLALAPREAQLLLRDADVRISDARTAELVERCEGWPAALHLAALAIRDGNGAPLAPRGDERYLSDYFRSEYLSELQPAALRFLRRTSLLDRMSGPLCDAVLETDGSGRELEEIERQNLFVVPLDDRREWYRYHRLFRGLLQQELAKDEPELVDVLHARAADWFQANGDEESALEHAYAGGDTDRAAAILDSIALPMYYSGRVPTLERWLERFERDGLVERYEAIALRGSWVHMLCGRSEDAERWSVAADHATSGPPAEDRGSLRGCLAVLRAWSCRAGAEQMRAHADRALAELPEESHWRAAALAAQGAALMLLGDCQAANETLALAADRAVVEGATEVEAVALGERAFIASELGDHELADELCTDLHRLSNLPGLESNVARSLELATTARSLLRHGRWDEARTALTAAREVIRFLTVATPWLAVGVRIELCRGFVTLRDSLAATELLAEIGDLLGQVTELGVLGAQADELQKAIDEMPEPHGVQNAGLSPAELRLLPLLATHLTFREIAEQLFVSRNTIKTQAISVYRKLGVSSRSQAVAEAHRLGLEEHLRVIITNGS